VIIKKSIPPTKTLLSLAILFASIPAKSNDLAVIRSEDGASASLYTSHNKLICGKVAFDLSLTGPHPVAVTEIKVNGKYVPADKIKAINSRIPSRSWFNGIFTSCTSARQSITLQLSALGGPLNVPLSFENGELVRIGNSPEK
jgi:hypothetical protein